jgi:hypothetical protein
MSTQEAATLSGVDPFATPRPSDPNDLEKVWFDAPTSSRRASTRPTAAPSAPPAPIGDREADDWPRQRAITPSGER